MAESVTNTVENAFAVSSRAVLLVLGPAPLALSFSTQKPRSTTVRVTVDEWGRFGGSWREWGTQGEDVEKAELGSGREEWPWKGVALAVALVTASPPHPHCMLGLAAHHGALRLQNSWQTLD